MTETTVVATQYQVYFSFFSSGTAKKSVYEKCCTSTPCNKSAIMFQTPYLNVLPQINCNTFGNFNTSFSDCA